MQTYLRDLIRKAPPCDYVEIRWEDIRTVRIVFMGKELEEVCESQSSGGCTRALVKGGWGFSSFNNLNQAPAFLPKAVSQANLSKRKKSFLARSRKVVKKLSFPLMKDPRKISLEEKVDLLSRYNSLLMTEQAVSSTQVRYHEVSKKKFFVNSNGSAVFQEKVDVGLVLRAIAREGGNVQAGSFDVGGSSGYHIVEGLEEAALSASREACALLRAEPVQPGRYAVVIDPQLTGLFAHEAFGHLSEADFLYENTALQKLMKVGKRFGPDFLNIVDQGDIGGAQGTYKYDDEGVPTQKTYIIKGGIFQSHLHSRETAAKMREPVTGNARALNYHYPPIVRMTNTFIEDGKDSLEELLAPVREGFYVVGDRGGQTNCEMFTFTAQKAYEIRNGKAGKLLRDVVLTGNVFETLFNIEAVGGDYQLFGSAVGGCGKDGQVPLPISLGGPSMRIRDVVIGGR